MDPTPPNRPTARASGSVGSLVAPADAATIILLRTTPDGPAVLMGQRSAGAAFMPSKFVFPGGRVDASDADVALARPLSPDQTRRLHLDAPEGIAIALAAAAIRELWEEIGLRLAGPPASLGPKGMAGWSGFDQSGPPLAPDAGAMTFVFRAVTPPGSPRRFDARFFIADIAGLADDPDDFSRASGELSHLRWVPLQQARDLSLPFITEIVLAEVAHLAANGRIAGGPPDGVPFFDNRGPVPRFRRLL